MDVEAYTKDELEALGKILERFLVQKDEYWAVTPRANRYPAQLSIDAKVDISIAEAELLERWAPNNFWNRRKSA